MCELEPRSRDGEAVPPPARPSFNAGGGVAHVEPLPRRRRHDGEGLRGGDPAHTRWRACDSGGSSAARGAKGEQVEEVGERRGGAMATPVERNRGGREGEAEKGRSPTSPPRASTTTLCRDPSRRPPRAPVAI
jgi:hypothetical protein